jgi:YVTN family beta-propeller protein
MSAHIKRALSAAAAVLSAAGVAMVGAAGVAAAPAHARQPAHPAAYIANYGTNKVTAIDATTSKVMATIRVGSFPGRIAVTPDGKTAYVATSRGVVPVDTATNTAGPVIRDTKGAGCIAVTPDGKTAYITYTQNSSTPDQVTVIDTATNTVIKQIAWITGFVWDTSPIVISPDGKTAYIASTAGTLTPLDTATNIPGKPIKLGFQAMNGNVYLAITPDGRTVYVTWSGPYGPGAQVFPVRTATGRVLPAIGIRRWPTAIVMSPDGKTVYVASAGIGAQGCSAGASCQSTIADRRANKPAAVTPISTATNTTGPLTGLGPTATPDWMGGGQTMAITPDGKMLYAVYNRAGGTRVSYVVPIRTATGTGLPRIHTARVLNSIAITADGKTAYVTRDRSRNWSDGVPGKAFPIYTATNATGPSVLVGAWPTTIAVTT